MGKSGLNFIILLLMLVSSSVVFAAIVGSGNSNINLIVSSGSFVNSNCSAGSAFTGVAAGGNFICNPFVFSITQGIGLLFNPNPITQSGVISLQNATELTIGGINVRNCTGTDRVSGFFGNMTPICSSTSTGTVTSISQGEGIVNNPNPITTTGVIQLANATNTTLGGIRLANCTGNDRFSGFNASLNPICSSTASGSAVEITLYEGLSSNQTPITSNATLLLRNATELTIGGTRVRNCSSGFHITGYFGNMTPICTGELNNGTVTSVDNGSGIVVNPDPITGSGLVLLANATNISIGGVMAENCTSGFHVSGWNSSLNPICSGDLVNGTVTSISEGEGIMANPNPIIAVGNILLRNATELLLGGIKVRNCSSTQGIVGWMANLTGICGDLGGAGLGIKQLTFGVGVSGNESPLLTNGTIFLKNASSTEIGGILASNCTGTDKLSGVTGGGALVCTADTGGAAIKQITIYEGLLSNETPITSNATLMLANATELTNGGTKVRNCTSGFHITGYFGNMTPICTGELNNGTVTSLTGENGITLNPTTITTTGVIMGTNATPASLGVIRTVNCTTGNYFDSFATNNTPICTSEVGDISSVQAGTGLQGGNLSGGAVLYLKNASASEIGGILASNCTSTDKFSGVTGGGVLTCTSDVSGSGGVKEIKIFAPLTGNESPIISNSTLMVNNATATTDGVVRMTNCSSQQFFNGYSAGNNSPICTSVGNGNGIKQATFGVGITGNESPLYSNGTIFLKNASSSEIGGILAVNCSQRARIMGFTGGGTPFCNDLGGNGTGIMQLTIGTGLGGNESPLYTNGTIFLNNASSGSIGGVTASNCTILESFTGITGGGAHVCTTNGAGRGVRQITFYTPLSGNESPLYTNGSLMVLNATTTAEGVVRVTNCSAGQFFNGYFAGNNSPMCGAAAGGGTVTSIDNGVGIVVNPDPIIGAGTVMLDNATTSTIGGTQILNCSTGQFVSGWTNGITPTCGAPVLPAGSGNTTKFIDRIYFSKTKTNVGTTWVDVYNTALDPEDTLMNTSNMSEFRLIVTNDYVGTGTQSLNLNQTTNNANRLWWFNSTADCDPCDSGWQPLPTWANSVEVFMEAQIVSTTAGDDPAFKGYQLLLRGRDAGENGTVTSISEGEGIMANPNPITSIGTILLRNATELLLGGVKVRNCSSTQGITGWFANLTGICSDLAGNGNGIKQLTFGVGLSGNESPLLNNGTIFLKNASASEIGGILSSNCTTGQVVTGVGAGGGLVCGNNTNLNDPYCNPTSNEDCIFYDFHGTPSALTTPTQFFDSATQSNACSTYNHELSQYGLGNCAPNGFLAVPLGISINSVGNYFFNAPTSPSALTSYCTFFVPTFDIPYNCSKVINNSHILEMSIRFSKNANFTAGDNIEDNITVLFGFLTRNDTGITTHAAWMPNNFENLIAFYHRSNDTNWSAITMFHGNASNTTTILPLDFNLTGNIGGMNTFKIIRENSTNNFLFYINSSLVANHSTNIPVFSTYSGLMILRHIAGTNGEVKYLMVDYMKYYMNKSTNSILSESYP